MVLEDLNFQKNGQNDKINIAFGSCYGLFNLTSPIFKAISESSGPKNDTPDIFIWGGDIAYLDLPLMKPNLNYMKN